MLLTAGCISLALTFPLLHTDVVEAVATTPAIAEVPLKQSNETVHTMIYIVTDKEVKVIKEFRTINDGRDQISQVGTQAIVNEVLINLLKKGYEVESVQDVPSDQLNSKKRCIGLTKPVGVEPTMTLVLSQSSL